MFEEKITGNSDLSIVHATTVTMPKTSDHIVVLRNKFAMSHKNGKGHDKIAVNHMFLSYQEVLLLI